MMNRREFHARLLATLAATALPLRAGATASPTPDDLWLNRLTFGATIAERASFAAMGPQAWLDDQLLRPVEDVDLQARLDAAKLRMNYEAGVDERGYEWVTTDELRPLSNLSADPASFVRLMNWETGMEYSERVRPANEVIAASLIRAVHAPAQLREVMTQFWHDHFSVNAHKNEMTAAFFPSHDAIMRTHAFGNFRVLLGEVARSPSMLFYLDNEASRASPANENYGRELLELHTLGAQNYLNDKYDDWRSVPGSVDGLADGYLDLDVYEVARAFTGWSVGDGRWLAEGEEAPRTGRFNYVEAWHDPYQKRILGVEFPPNAAPMADGDRVLDILATHPGTARYVCTKIARRLLADEPDTGLVDQMVSVFLAASDADDQIAQVIRALVGSSAFDTPPQKLRRPFEVLVALYRATGAQVSSTENGFQWQLARAGWRQHEYGPPTGHPDRAANWTGASTLNRVVDLALFGHDDWFGCASIDLTALVAGETAGDFCQRWAGALNPTGAGAATQAVAEAMGFDVLEQADALNPENRREAAAMAIAFAAMTPEFLLR